MADLTPEPYPFPHCIVDGHWDDDILDGVVSEFPHPDDPRWQRFDNEHERKLGGTPDMWGTHTRQYMDQLEALTPQLSEAFGIEGLSMETVGGGMHLIPPGGHLDIHTDFNRSPGTGLYRRLNCLTFLNHNWPTPEYPGALELWPEEDAEHWCESCEGWDPDSPIMIHPEFNRMVVFETSDRSWHGHERKADRWRLSVAAYMFSAEPPPGYRSDHSTVWR